VLSSPVGSFEGTEECGNDVCNPLGCVKSTVFWSGEGPLVLGSERIAKIEKRSNTAAIRIAKMEIPKNGSVESVFIPVKGRKTDRPVCFEELMYVFPCT